MSTETTTSTNTGLGGPAQGQLVLNDETKSRVITIREVQSWYSQDSGIIHCSALRELTEILIKQNIRTEFENDSFLDALILSELMLKRSSQTIRMLTGGCDKFINTLQDSFLQAFARLSGKPDGKVKIVILSQSIPPLLISAKEQFPNTLDFRSVGVAAGAEIEHFLVCDSEMARVEKPHKALTDETAIDEIKAKVSFNNPSLAKFYESRFDAIWDVLVPKETSSNAVAA